jgi:hypothetical protein
LAAGGGYRADGGRQPRGGTARHRFSWSAVTAAGVRCGARRPGLVVVGLGSIEGRTGAVR